MLGLVTIGQAPRDDVVKSMFGDRVPSSVVQAGALDDLTIDNIRCLAPDPTEHVLVTRLRDGSEAVVAKQRILELVHGAVRRIEQAGARVICVVCTGTFPPLGQSSRVVYPDRIVTGVVNGVIPAGTLGVLMPHQDQEESMRTKWSAPGRDVVVGTASPYDPQASLRGAIDEMVTAGVDAIVMDCMGYDRQMLQAVRCMTDAPVLLANGVVAAVLHEMMDLSHASLDEAK